MIHILHPATRHTERAALHRTHGQSPPALHQRGTELQRIQNPALALLAGLTMAEHPDGPAPSSTRELLSSSGNWGLARQATEILAALGLWRMPHGVFKMPDSINLAPEQTTGDLVAPPSVEIRKGAL